jgi:hypothetical protein
MSDSISQSSLSADPIAKSFSTLGINLEKAFNLIGSIFPFELCLQHKIVPLNLINDSVILGMVNSQETSVLQGFQPMLKSHNYLIKKKVISVDILKKILSEYLKYKKAQLSDHKSSIRSEFTGLYKEEEQIKNKGRNSSTLIIENTQNLIENLPLEEKNYTPDDLSLNLSFKYVNKPIESLIDLPAQQLISELLARVIKEKVNQINVENFKDHGAISWQKGKQSQILINKIPKTKVETIINELKKLLFLPLKPVTNIKKIESLRTYKNSKILLRLKVVPSPQGEQSFLYLFWGKMLQDYQDYQLSRLGKEALLISEALDEKIKQIIQRSQFYENSDKEISYFHQLQDKMYYQIDLLSSIIEGK